MAVRIWTPLLVGTSVLMGNQILEFWAVYESYALLVLVGAVLVLYGFFHFVIPLATHKGRRRVRSRWARYTRWEFWPSFVLYQPIYVYIAYLAAKYRSLTVFTAVNPAIPHSGFIGESKSDILDLFKASSEYVARYKRVSEPETGAQQTVAFMLEEGLSFPIVLKPDVGERGHGVIFARNESDLVRFFGANQGSVIVQEYIPGQEFGVFYIRRPSEKRGTIFSLTRKKLISVVGDGKRTLEELILDDERANYMYPTFFERFSEQLDTIVGKGEHFQLVKVGTHARGALFLDGSDLISEQLTEVFNTICNSVNGFHFGRFDVRALHESDIQTGVTFKILELNGVTSEATHIYDPSNSVRYAYRVLRKQWRIAFEIGRENMSNGVKTSSVKELLQLLYRYHINPKIRPDTSASVNV